MITYIPNQTVATNRKEWKSLMRDTINQIIQYPTNERPYCDLAIIAPQVNKLYNHPKDLDNILEFNFGDYYMLFNQKVKRWGAEYTILTGKRTSNFLAEVQIRGEIPKYETENYIYFRDFILGTPTINKGNSLDFSEITKRINNSKELAVQEILATPNFKSESENFKNLGNGFFW